MLLFDFFFLNFSGFRWSDTLSMMIRMGQLMRYGDKFQKNYPWLSWWLTARKGCLQRNLNALAYVQTRLPLGRSTTTFTIGFGIPWTLWLSFVGRFRDDERKLVRDNDSCKYGFSHISHKGWVTWEIFVVKSRFLNSFPNKIPVTLVRYAREIICATIIIH